MRLNQQSEKYFENINQSNIICDVAKLNQVFSVS